VRCPQKIHVLIADWESEDASIMILSWMMLYIKNIQEYFTMIIHSKILFKKIPTSSDQ
jgi:hypothetical protein